MLSEERFSAILEILKQQKTISVSKLSEILKISESTVRRDIIALNEMGKLKKIHGGAMAIKQKFTSTEPSVNIRATQNTAEKKSIARYASTLINDDDFIFIDAGTTTEKMIDFIENKSAVFVTNGIVHAKKLIQKGLKAYIIGGELKLSTEAVIGSQAVNTINNYNFTKSFVGTNGISLSSGYTTPDPEEALIKSAAINHSYVSFVLADSSKFDIVSSVTFAKISQACIVTDRVKDKKYLQNIIVKETAK